MPELSSSSLSSSACAAGVVSIQLTPLFETEYPVGDKTGYRLRITASDGCHIENEIFAYYQKPADSDGVVASMFSHVCSWMDMETLPTSGPGATDDPPMFRRNRVDLVLDTVEDVESMWEGIQQDVQHLLDVMTKGLTLVAGTAVLIDGSL